MDAHDAGLTFVLGGARSGKSTYAEALAARLSSKVLYVATAEALDDEMRARVIAHRARRPTEWGTLECPLQVGATLQTSDAARGVDVILVDCLTVLVSNVILHVESEAQTSDGEAAWLAVRKEVDALLEAQRQIPCQFVIVSNEVGQGVVPAYDLGRTYRDCLGSANQLLARAADHVIWMVAGLPVDAKSLPMAWPDDYPTTSGSSR